MDYLFKCASAIQDETVRAKLLKILEREIPLLKSLPASFTHHVETGGGYDFACKVVRSAHKIYVAMGKDVKAVTLDDVLFVSTISCLDIPRRLRRGEMIGMDKSGTKQVFKYEKIGDWAVDPAFFIADILAREDIFVSPETYHALSLRDGAWSEFHRNRSPQDLSPLATILHSAFMLSMNFPQSTPTESEAILAEGDVL